MTELRRKKNRTADILFAAFILCAGLFLVRMAPFGFHFFDEAYWLTLPHRLLRGEALFVDDWSLTQTGLLLLYPLMKLYRLFFEGTEGIILWFRYAFIFFHALSAVILYLLLRKKSAQTALFAAALYFISTGYMKALSYYQMAQGFALISAAILSTTERPSLALPLSGVFFALAVLACPYLVFVYVIYTGLCVLSALCHRKENTAFCMKSWLLFSGGCAAAAIVFFLFVFSRCTPAELLVSVPLLFGDKTHSVGMAGKKLLRFLPDLFACLKITDLPAIIAVAVIAVDRRRRQRKAFYTLAAAITAVLALAVRYRGALIPGMLTYDNGMKIPLCVFALAAYCLCEKKDRKIFLFMYWGSLVFLLCLYLASDTGLNVLSGPLTIMTTASAIFIVQLASELLRDGEGQKLLRYSAAGLCILLFTAQLGVEFMYRKNFCFSEPAGTSMMYFTIDHGIGQGERTTEAVKVYEMEGLWEATEKVRNAEGDYVLYFSSDCWPYLEDSKKCASFSTWIQGGASLAEAERLLLYWELHPEKKPDAIYVSKAVKESERVLELLNTEDFPIEENERGYVLLRTDGQRKEGE